VPPHETGATLPAFPDPLAADSRLRACGGSQRKLIDGASQMPGLLSPRFGCSCNLLYECCILLRDTLHLRNGLADFAQDVRKSRKARTAAIVSASVWTSGVRSTSAVIATLKTINAAVMHAPK